MTYINHLDKNNMKYPGIVIEFKVFNFRKEDTLKDTLSTALKQINEKDYVTELTGRGVKKENIRHYGFAFQGERGADWNRLINIVKFFDYTKYI